MMKLQTIMDCFIESGSKFPFEMNIHGYGDIDRYKVVSYDAQRKLFTCIHSDSKNEVSYYGEQLIYECTTILYQSDFDKLINE